MQRSQQHPPVDGRPTNIAGRMDDMDVIYIETAMPPPSAPAPPSGQHNADSAVLKRNQACLARPHCATCVRSHKHLMRTAPRTNPVMNCDYDDGVAGEENRLGGAGSDGSVEDDDVEVRKKKRKAPGEARRNKKKSSELDDERDRLAKRIEELEMALAKKSGAGGSGSSKHAPNADRGGWAQPNAPQETTVPSPTAFLDMLSSAASSQLPHPPPVPGFRTSGSESTMLPSFSQPNWSNPSDMSLPDTSSSGTASGSGSGSGFTPFLAFSDSPKPVERTVSNSTSGEDSSHRQSFSTSGTGLSPYAGNSGMSPSNILSPNGIFNFSPGPTNWIPTPNATGHIEPSTLTEGPWRAIETTTTLLASIAADSQTLPPPEDPPTPVKWREMEALAPFNR
ncbi:hypothetical protein P7C73_g2894, partial [Tremellales sp. Uapishka_1]